MAKQSLNQEKNSAGGGSDPREKNNSQEIEAKMENYTGPEGLTTKQLEIGLWYVEHKWQLKWLLYGFLILVGAVSWAYTIYGFAYYLASGMNEDEILARQLVQTSSIGHDYVLQISAKDLAVGPVEIIKSADKKYDLFALIKNDNQKWWAEFDYYFISAGAKTEKISGYILPSEEKYLLALARDYVNFPSDAQLIMENIRWHRINQHQIPDWDAYYKEHLDIISTDIKFTPASASPLAEKLNLNQLSFNAVNQTPFNFWETGFIILMSSGGGLVNINHYILSDFMSGEKRFVEISWPGDVGRVDKIEIIPEINIMKDDIYIKYDGGVGQEK